jgi:RHS repeat-associated protein
MVNSQGWFTLVPDMQGGNTLVLNSNGSVKSVQLYAPYGSVRYSDGTSPTAHNYTGQRLDGTTGLLYYNARYYDPISGCFTSTDTVETNASGSDPYAYVDDNPETKTDPTGQMMYDPATGQAGRIVNGKAEVWQYNSGIDSSGTSDTTSQVVASNIWSIYTWTWWTPPVYDVNWAPPVTHSAPVQHKQGIKDFPPSITSCGVPESQATCGNFGVNYAMYTSTGSVLSVPGEWCLICVGGGEGGQNGDHGGTSEIMTSSDEAGVTQNAGGGKYEQDLGDVASYEQARNKALDILGDLGPDSEPYVGRLHGGEGLVVGRQSEDGLARWRLDYDPDKLTHINVEDFRAGKAGAGGLKGYIKFPGDEGTFESLLRHLNR